jgi:hypothetical protein
MLCTLLQDRSFSKLLPAARAAVTDEIRAAVAQGFTPPALTIRLWFRSAFGDAKMKAVPQPQLHSFIVGKLYERWEVVEAAHNGIDRRKKRVDQQGADASHSDAKPNADALRRQSSLSLSAPDRAIGGAPFGTRTALSRTSSSSAPRQICRAEIAARAASAEPPVSAEAKAAQPHRPSTTATAGELCKRDEKRLAAERRLVASIAGELGFGAANAGAFDSDGEDDPLLDALGEEGGLVLDDVTKTKQVTYIFLHTHGQHAAHDIAISCNAARRTAANTLQHATQWSALKYSTAYCSSTPLWNAVRHIATPQVFFKMYRELDGVRASASQPATSALEPIADEASPLGIRAAARAYLSSCERLGLAPRPVIVPRNGRDDKLNLAHYGITDAMMQAIASALPFMPRTRELNLEHNSIDRDGCAALSECLGALRLESLDLSHSRGISHGIDYLARALHDLHTPAPTTPGPTSAPAPAAHTLKRLVLSHNKLSVRALSELMRALAWSNTVVDLVLSHNELDDHSGYELSLALPRMKALRLLDLSWNCLRRRHVGTSLHDWNVKLETLILAHNSLGAADGAEEVALALADNGFLTSLDLSFNRITSSVCGVLEQALMSNRKLTSLDVGGNPVGCAGARALMRIIQMDGRGGVSTHVHMRGCNFSKRDGDDVDPAAPAGTYSLLLSRSQDRMRARELLRLAWEGRGGAWKWANVRLNDRAFALPAAQPGAMPEVELPSEGKLDFAFVDSITTAEPLTHGSWQAKLRMLQRIKVSGGDEAQREAARLVSADLSLNAADAVAFLKGICDPSVQSELLERMLPLLRDADVLHAELGAAFGDGVLRLRSKLGRLSSFHAVQYNNRIAEQHTLESTQVSTFTSTRTGQTPVTSSTLTYSLSGPSRSCSSEGPQRCAHRTSAQVYAIHRSLATSRRGGTCGTTAGRTASTGRRWTIRARCPSRAGFALTTRLPNDQSASR